MGLLLVVSCQAFTLPRRESRRASVLCSAGQKRQLPGSLATLPEPGRHIPIHQPVPASMHCRVIGVCYFGVAIGQRPGLSSGDTLAQAWPKHSASEAGMHQVVICLHMPGANMFSLPDLLACPRPCMQPATRHLAVRWPATSCNRSLSEWPGAACMHAGQPGAAGCAPVSHGADLASPPSRWPCFSCLTMPPSLACCPAAVGRPLWPTWLCWRTWEQPTLPSAWRCELRPADNDSQTRRWLALDCVLPPLPPVQWAVCIPVQQCMASRHVNACCGSMPPIHSLPLPWSRSAGV